MRIGRMLSIVGNESEAKNAGRDCRDSRLYVGFDLG